MVRFLLCSEQCGTVTDGTLKGSFLPLPGAVIPSGTVRKAAKLLPLCGGFGKLSVFLGKQVLDRSGSPGKAWVKEGSTLCIPFCPRE